MSVPELVVEIAWTAGPYDASPSWSNVSTSVRKVSVRRGRSSDFDDSFSSTASITFDNNARLFDPFNSSGANYANLKPRKQVRIRGLVNGTYYPIFRGYINGFPVTWSNSGFSSTVTVQAYDLLSLLATANLKNDLADVYTRSLNPYHYYKCSDPNGSTVIKDYGSAGEDLNIASTFAGRQLASSYSLGIGLSGSSADLSNTFYTKNNTGVTPTSRNLTFAFWGAWPSGFAGEQTTGIDSSGSTAASIAFYPNYPSTGSGFIEAWNVGSSSADASTETNLDKVTSAAPSHYVFTYNGTTISIYVNGVDRSKTSTRVNGTAGPFFPTRSVWLWGGLFQEVAIFNAVLTATQISDMYKYGAGSATESTSARASRLMALTDVPAGLYSISGTSYGEVLGVPEPNMNIRDALAQVMRTEAGYLFVTKAGVLTTQHRNYFLTNSTSTTSQATISDTGSGVLGYTGDVEIWYDGDNFRNDIAVDYGSGVQALSSNGTSITNFGRHTYSLTTQSSTTAEAQEIADHLFAYYSLIIPSVSAIEVGLGATTNAEWAQILGLEVLDRVTFKRTPSTGSAFQQDLSLNSIEYDIVPTRWSVKLNGSARFAPSAPTASISAATSVTGTTATFNGTVSANYFSTTVQFQYSTSSIFSSYSSVTATQSPTLDQSVSVSAPVTGLSHGTTYYVRVVATNAIGAVTSSSSVSLTTSVASPTATTSAASSVTHNAATLNGTVSANGASTTVKFQYNTTNNFASYTEVTATQSPVSGQSVSVSASLTGISASTTYYFRIVATNSQGTATTASTSFATSAAWAASGGSVTSSGGYTIHTFTGSGTFTVTGGGSKSIDVLVVAGGAGGSGYYGGSYGIANGGGAGGLSAFTTSVAASSNTITIGAGGAAQNGGNSSSAIGTTVTGGSAGGFSYTGGTAGTNGSAGGGGGRTTQYNSDESFNMLIDYAGGGGGRSGAGQAGSVGYIAAYTSFGEPYYVPKGGDGGAAFSNNYSGSSVSYARGGAGAAWATNNGSWNGYDMTVQTSTPQSAGQANRGDGGGTIFTNQVTVAEYAGGSGIVIIRYLT